MRESVKAKQAFNDYAAMGAERSLEKLAQAYQSRTGNVPTRQLSRLKVWSTTFGWQARLAEIAEAERQAIIARGIADKQNRVGDLQDARQRIRALIEARAADLKDEVPGGDTGLLVREPMLAKVYGTLSEEDGQFIPLGKSELVFKYAFDAAVLRELREVLKQAAQELGQWNEKGDTTGEMLVREYVGIAIEDV